MLTSASAIVRRTSTTRPRAVIDPPAGAGRNSRSDSSAVVSGVAGGSSVWIAQAIAASAGIVSGPIEIAPCGVHSHLVSGIEKAAVPTPHSVMRMPVSREIGGCEAVPAISASSRSAGRQPNVSGPK
jgi:hypothetical protein